MQLEEIHFNSKFLLLSGQKEILKNIIEWKDTPPLVKSGRSTFLVIDNKDVPFTGIKIKGCGYFNQAKNEILPPTGESAFDIHIVNSADGIREIHYVVVVNDKNEIDFAVPKKRPFGGQVFSRAKLEYDVNRVLYENWKDTDKNFPFYFPVGYAKYNDLHFNDENMGTAILGLPYASEIALSPYFEGSFEEKGLKINPHIINYWRNYCAPLGKTDPDYFDLLTAVQKLCFEFGSSLKNFHEHFVDFDSHMFNAAVNMDSGKVILFDFDHSQAAEGMHPQKYFYFSMKDFEAGLVAILSNFLLSGLSEGVILFDEMGQSFEGYNPVLAYFEGYFGDLPDNIKDEAKQIWERMLMLIMNKLLNTEKEKIIHIVYDFCEFERNKSYLNLFDIFHKKTLNKYQNLELTPEKHKEIMENFHKKLKDFAGRHKA